MKLSARRQQQVAALLMHVVCWLLQTLLAHPHRQHCSTMSENQRQHLLHPTGPCAMSRRLCHKPTLGYRHGLASAHIRITFQVQGRTLHAREYVSCKVDQHVLGPHRSTRVPAPSAHPAHSSRCTPRAASSGGCAGCVAAVESSLGAPAKHQHGKLTREVHVHPGTLWRPCS